MKKRGRKPNSRTYTVMLDGLGNAQKGSGLDIVKTALSIYQSINSPGSIVRPNIIHGNAMLNVCRHQGDMDVLWRVAGDLPEEGPGAPDPRTYTIILRAIREGTEKDIASLGPTEVDKIFERKARCVKEARRIWSDIIFQWKREQLAIDHHVLDAMAKALLNGSSERDYYDVFALYNQTCGIPILAHKPADDESRPKKVRDSYLEASGESTEDVPFVGEHKLLAEEQTGSTDELEKEDEKEEEEEDFESLFDPVVSPDAQSSRGSSPKGSQRYTPSLLLPGNRELTLILEACRTMTQAIGVGKAYWEHLTLEDHRYKIEPDAHSFHQYLRLLRVGRSSLAAVRVVRDEMVPAEQVQSKTFHIALSCCRRDRRNINVFKNANELLELMDAHLPLPEPRALIGYLEIVDILAESPHFLMSLDAGDEYRSTKLDVFGRKLQLALWTDAASNLRPHMAKLDAAMEQGYSVTRRRTSSRARRVQADAIPGHLALKAITRTRALIDTILKPENGSFISESDRQLLQQESRTLRKYSKPDVIAKFKTSLVLPAEQH